MSNSLDLISSLPGILDDHTIQNIIKAIEDSNSQGLRGNKVRHYYCSQSTNSNNDNSLGIHLSFIKDCEYDN